MGGVNAAIEVGKHELHIALGSAGELSAERNEPRAVKRLAKRLAEASCERVLIEGGSYQNLLVAINHKSQPASNSYDRFMETGTIRDSSALPDGLIQMGFRGSASAFLSPDLGLRVRAFLGRPDCACATCRYPR